MIRLHNVAIVAALFFIPAFVFAQINWTPSTRGVEGSAVYVLHETASGALLARTRLGLYRLGRGEERWDQVIDTMSKRYPEWTFANGPGTTVHLAADGRHYRSDDDGVTWVVVASSDTLVAAGSGGDGDAILIGSRGTSRDGGATWYASTLTTDAPVVWLAPGRFLTVAGTRTHTWSDASRKWLPRYDIEAMAQIVAFDSNYLVGVSPTSNRVLRSANGGLDWGWTTFLPIAALARLGPSDVVLASHTPLRKVDDGLYLSSDTGKSWTRVNLSGFFNLHGTKEGVLWAGTTLGMQRSTDRGETWTRHSTGINERRASVQADRTGHFYVSAEYERFTFDNGYYNLAELLVSRDDGASWTHLLDSIQKVIPLDTDLLAAGTIGHRWVGEVGMNDLATRVSADGGATWRTLSRWALRTAAIGPSGVAAIVTDASDPSDSTMFVSTDRGMTWVGRRPGLALYVSITPSGKILAATRKGSSADPVRLILRSQDSGRTWRVRRDSSEILGMLTIGDSIVIVHSRDMNGMPQLERSVDTARNWSAEPRPGDRLSSMQLVNGVPLVVWYTDSGFVIERSLDSGATWTRTKIEKQPWISPGGEIFSLRPDGMIRSTDLGVSWQLIDREIDWTGIASNGRVMVATHPSRGLYRSDGTVAVPAESPRAEQPRLAAWPLPASDRLYVDAVVDGAGTLRLVDLLGHVVLTQEIQNSKVSVVDVSALPVGVFFVQVESSSGVAVGRVVVARGMER